MSLELVEINDNESIDRYTRCCICGDGRYELKYYFYSTRGEKSFVCSSCANKIEDKYFYKPIDNVDPLEDYKIAKILRIYKTSNDFTIADFGFNDGIHKKVDLGIYGYWFIPNHINAYTLIYDERIEETKIENLYKKANNAGVFIFYDENGYTPLCIVMNNLVKFKTSTFEVFNYADVEKREKLFDPIFKNKDINVFFIDTREKIPFDDWR